MIVDRGSDISQLIRKHLKTLTISRDIGKYLPNDSMLSIAVELDSIVVVSK